MTSSYKSYDRIGTKSSEINSPSTADRIAKKGIFEVARNNYLENVPLVPTLLKWGTSKYTLVKTDSSFLNINSSGPKLVGYNGYYDYSEQDNIGVPETWVSFANNELGGGYKKNGWVQEEIITVEFFEMVHGITQYEKNGENVMGINEAVLWFNLIRNSQSNPQKYGGRTIRAEQKNKSFDPNSYIGPLDNYDRPQIANFVSIDAPYRRNRNSQYNLKELQHLFIKALTGFEACAKYGYSVINTGHWGAGAFNNKFEVVLMVQYLAAWMAGIKEIRYWGLKDSQKDKGFNDVWEFLQNVGGFSVKQVYDRLSKYMGLNFSLEQIFEPIQQAAQQPAQQPVQQPVQQPIQQPAQQPVQQQPGLVQFEVVEAMLSTGSVVNVNFEQELQYLAKEPNVVFSFTTREGEKVYAIVTYDPKANVVGPPVDQGTSDTGLPVEQGSLDPNKWYWKSGRNKWNLYDESIQNNLDQIKNKQQRAEFMIGNDTYTVMYLRDKGKWVQRTTRDGDLKQRDVIPPSRLR